MRITLPKWLRISIYVVNALAAPVVVYLLGKDLIGPAEVQLWAAEVAAMAALAGLNVPSSPE